MRFDDEKQFASFLGRNVVVVKKAPARKSCFAPLLLLVDADKRDDDDADEEEEEESNAPCANPRQESS